MERKIDEVVESVMLLPDRGLVEKALYYFNKDISSTRNLYVAKVCRDYNGEELKRDVKLVLAIYVALEMMAEEENRVRKARKEFQDANS